MHDSSCIFITKGFTIEKYFIIKEKVFPGLQSVINVTGNDMF